MVKTTEDPKLPISCPVVKKIIKSQQKSRNGLIPFSVKVLQRSSRVESDAGDVLSSSDALSSHPMPFYRPRRSSEINEHFTPVMFG